MSETIQHHDHSEDEAHGHHFEVIEEGIHHVHSSKKEIWKVFFILLAITVLEFIIALTPAFKAMGKSAIVGIFFFLTVLKAFYIVGNFMHLRHERINMAYSILVPFLFIIYLIALLLIEGNYQA
jgi:cytochrome c oxidase subunit IV